MYISEKNSKLSNVFVEVHDIVWFPGSGYKSVITKNCRI